MKNFTCQILILFISTCLFSQVTRTAFVRSFNVKPTLLVDNEPVTPDFCSLTHAYGASCGREELPLRNLKIFC